MIDDRDRGYRQDLDDAYVRGRHDALAELRTVAQVAALLGVNTSRVHQIARELGVGWTIGRERLFRPADVDALRARPDGRRRS